MPLVTQAPVQANISKSVAQADRHKHLVKLGAWTVGVLVGLFLIATYVIGPYQVQGVSMQPTFYTNDIVLVWELPQTWAKITGGQYLPKRGSVVVIKKSPILGEQLIKRVIGVPGDHVVITNKQLTVYNSAHPDGFKPDSAPYGQHLLQPSDDFSTQVSDGQLFVMGDNRTTGASIDSRSSLGNVPSGNLVGKVVLRIFPFNNITLF